jgi:transcriptional regulator with XRE-family HTH domain
MKQVEFARKIDTTESVVSHWVNGHVCPEYRQLDRIVDVLKIPYEELVRDPQAVAASLDLTFRDVDTILRELAAARGYVLRKK